MDLTAERQIFTLKQVAHSIRKTIEDRYQRLYWVQAEMHKLNYTAKGHCYPELVQKDEGKIVAEMRGTIWKTQFDRISRNFTEIVREPLRDGLHLLFQVRIVFHPLYGMGLEIVDIDPTFALGELQKEREETLKRLTREGILNANQQLKLPLLPQRIALISMDSSKGLSDFYNIVHKNPWSYRFFFMLFPAQLNGDLAIGSIQQQLRRIEKVKHHFDAVAIIRGGGGEIGLSCYNNYELSKAIATFPLPVLTGIGHSTNITVSEMVAFRNAITPTELAEFLLQCFHNFSLPVEEARGTIVQEAGRLLESTRKLLSGELRVFRNVSAQQIFRTRQVLRNSSLQLKTQARFRFNREELLLQRNTDHLEKGVSARNTRERDQLQSRAAELRKLSARHLSQKSENIQDVKYYVLQQIPRYFLRKEQEISLAEKQVRLMDPHQVLRRGYSMSLFEGKTISAENPVSPGDTIETITFDQHIISVVRELKTPENE